MRAGREEGVRRLDALRREIDYLPITTDAMRLAARFRADARRRGQPTASDEALDGDVILAAQAVTLAEEEGLDDVVIATTNVGHLSRFAAAERWEEIEPSP